jgi:hypothetical protein
VMLQPFSLHVGLGCHERACNQPGTTY